MYPLRFFLIALLSLLSISTASSQLSQDTFECILYNESKQFSFSEINDVDIDSDGYIWLSMQNSGLLRINQNEGKSYDLSSIGTRNDVHCFYEDPNKNVFIGRNQGIGFYNRNKDQFKSIGINYFSNLDGYSNSVYAIIKIPNGKYLIGTKAGVHIYNLEQDSIEAFHITGTYEVDGLSSDKHIYDFVLDEKRNTVWCTSRKGLIKINLSDYTVSYIICPFNKTQSWQSELMDEIYLFGDELFINYTKNRILSYDIIEQKWDLVFNRIYKEFLPSLKRDSSQLLFYGLSSYKGRYILLPTTRQGIFILDMSTKEIFKPYLKNDRFYEINKFENANWLDHKYASETYFGLIDKYGYLWTSDIREIIVKTKVPILQVEKKPFASPLKVSQFWIDNRPVNLAFYNKDSSEYHFKSYERDIAIKFDLINPPLEEYSLEYAVNGSVYKPNFNGTIATLNNLNGGANEIKLRATANGTSIQTQSIILEIEKLWHEKTINRLLVIFSILLLLGTIYWLWSARLKEKRRLETEFNKRIAEVKMSAFRAQMNPHFMFNSLNSINQFIIKMEPQKASEYLSKFSHLMRQVLNNSNSNLIILEDDLKALGLYLEMESLRFDSRFNYKIEIDDQISIKNCLIAPLLIQPYVENAIWHGIMPKNEEGHIDISIQKDNGNIKISIDDNGIGRVASLKINKSKIIKSQSLGMQITKTRLGLIEEIYGIKSKVVITDKYIGETANGTLVELTIPYLSKDKLDEK